MNAQAKIMINGVSLPYAPYEASKPKTYGKTPAEIDAEKRIPVETVIRNSPALTTARAGAKQRILEALASGPKCRVQVSKAAGMGREHAGVLLHELKAAGKVRCAPKFWNKPAIWSLVSRYREVAQ